MTSTARALKHIVKVIDFFFSLKEKQSTTRLSIRRVHMNVVPRSTGNTNSGTEN